MKDALLSARRACVKKGGIFLPTNAPVNEDYGLHTCPVFEHLHQGGPHYYIFHAILPLPLPPKLCPQLLLCEHIPILVSRFLFRPGKTLFPAGGPQVYKGARGANKSAVLADLPLHLTHPRHKHISFRVKHWRVNLRAVRCLNNGGEGGEVRECAGGCTLRVGACVRERAKRRKKK